MADPAVARDNWRESAERDRVSVGEKILARVASAGQMIDRAGNIKRRGRAMRRLYQVVCRIARPDPECCSRSLVLNVERESFGAGHLGHHLVHHGIIGSVLSLPFSPIRSESQVIGESLPCGSSDIRIG